MELPIQYEHEPVLLDKVLEQLCVRETGVYMDCTYGRGGHARAILKRLGMKGRLLAIDRDPAAVLSARGELASDSRFHIAHGSFGMLKEFADRFGVTGKVDGILFDLGVSSPQLDDPQRGFSFLRDGPLDMRMDPGSGISAADWLAACTFAELAGVLKEYGKERYAKRIAREIIDARETAPIRSTGRLASIITGACPAIEKGKHPATRCFQAIRIFLNNELQQIEEALGQVLEVLAVGGRLLVISFHSLEDRLVKRYVRAQARGDEYPPDMPVAEFQLRPRLRVIGRSMRASKREMQRNPRSRSAILRVAERCA